MPLIRDLPQDDSIDFTNLSQDVEHIYEYLGVSKGEREFASFFVRIENGGYRDLWGVWGIVPRPHKWATPIIEDYQMIYFD